MYLSLYFKIQCNVQLKSLFPSKKVTFSSHFRVPTCLIFVVHVCAIKQIFEELDQIVKDQEWNKNFGNLSKASQ